MVDYGHELRFGTFVTPSSRNPEAVVALARLAEQAGLDLVTFQDHPYQPAFLDTWTLLSYVAAATTTVRLAPNVANLPLRQPAVLARSAASLDLLSGGRVELGLGAGAFWEAVQAMGGPRRTPREATDAFAEAIEVVRAIWDTETSGGVKVAGEHYRVVGAKRGPAPAHDIEIWVGAYGPRMLRLTGRVANGWLPSLGYVAVEQLADGNAMIDEAAQAAGRSPEALRRLLNVGGRFATTREGFLAGPPAQWIEELTELALTYGVSTFITPGDDPDHVRRFALEVAPGVRDAVDRERLRPGIGEAVREGARAQPPGNAAHSGLGVTPTPDDGVRLSARLPWDESARPEAPKPVDATYSAPGRAAAQHLVDIHDHLRSELEQVRELVARVRQGTLDVGRARSAINEMTLRQNSWTMGAYCASYCRIVTGHHSLEDQAIFPYLRRERTLAPVIDRLVEEHVVIHGVLDGVDRALAGHLDDPEDFTAVQAALDLLTDTLLSHLAYEERELVEPLARLGFYPGQLHE